MSSACLLSVENFSHRVHLPGEVESAERKENSQAKQNNILTIKQSKNI